MAVSTEFKIVDKATAVLSKISSKVDTMAISFNRLENRARIGLSRIGDSFPKLDGRMTAFFNKMETNASSMVDKIKTKLVSLKLSFNSLFALYLGFKTLQSFFNLNDKIINSNIKLGMLGKDKTERTQIENQIFNTSQKLGVDYTDFQNQVYKLSKMTGDTFKNEFETIRFNEIMQNTFKVSGASTAESTNAMYQLTQALGSGRLQGDEFRSIAEQAPMLSRKIAETMGVSYGKLKKLGSEGKITASIIKKAVFSMADELDQKVAEMPLTWAQRFNQISNYILKALKPAILSFQKLGQNPLVINLFRVLGVVVYVASVAISGLVTILDKAFRVINFLLPVLAILSAMITLIYSKILITTAITAIWGIMTSIATLATGGLTTAIKALNAAMYANPIGLILAAIVGIIGAIVVIIKVMNKLSGTTHTVLGSIIGGFFIWGAVIGNIFIGLWNYIKSFINTLASAFGDLGQAIAMAFKSPFTAVGYMVRGLMSYILGSLRTVASISDAVLGTNYAGIISGYEEVLDKKINSFFGLEEKKDPVFKMTQRLEYKNAFEKGANLGDNWQNKLSNAFKTPENYNSIESYLKGINDNTSDIKSNTEEYKENIKLMRDLANRDLINKVSSPVFNVEVYQTNTVPNKESARDVISVLNEELNEAVTRVALGGVN